MSLYGVLLFVHVLAIATWVGGGIMLHVFTEWTIRSNDVNRIRSFVDDAEVLGKKYFGPASGIAIIAGVWLVFEGDWGFSQPFVIGGIAGFVLSTILGFGIIQPTATKLKAALAGATSITEEHRPLLDKVSNVSRIDLVVLVIVVFLMTVKPGT